MRSWLSYGTETDKDPLRCLHSLSSCHFCSVRFHRSASHSVRWNRAADNWHLVVYTHEMVQTVLLAVGDPWLADWRVDDPVRNRGLGSFVWNTGSFDRVFVFVLAS